MTKSTRLHLLDALRGLTLISMIAYHAMWNLVHLYDFPGHWYTGPGGYIWQQSICWTFILLSGFCFCLGRNPLKRGLMIFLEKILRKAPPLPGLIVSGVLFFLLRNIPSGSLGFEGLVLAKLPRQLYRNYLTAYLGFSPAGFYSADYFPLIPWFFLFVVGYFLFRVFRARGWNERLFAKGEFPLLNFLGRNSLIVYLLHQPIIFGLMELFLK